MINVQRRTDASPGLLVLAPVSAVALTLATGGLMFFLLGFDPQEVMRAYFVKPLGDLRGLAELAVKATPLIVIGLGLSFAFRADVWNIGAEGQYLLGAIGGSSVALAFHETGGGWVLPSMVAAGVAGGVLWAMIPAFLKTRLNVSEILSGLMLNYVAFQLLLYLVHGPLKNPAGNNFPISEEFGEAALLPGVLSGTRLNLGFPFALLLVGALYALHARGLFGFRARVMGLAKAAAGFAGIGVNKMTVACMAISGGLAGLAGIFEVAGPIGHVGASVSAHYGYTAIIVAFLGRLHPIGVVMAGAVVALTHLGGEFAQISMGIPTAATGVFQSMLLFFLLACDFLRVYQIKWNGGN